ncbi:MAG: hypothetical protein QOH61_1808 [Chloroflexota bacterium]|jgi:drug/metabolite transporter (DMT)-like permease|nr:hypothetical protein [Chloroflexota bacterium]
MTEGSIAAHPGTVQRPDRRGELIGTLLVLGSAAGFALSGTLSRLAGRDGMGPIDFLALRAVVCTVALAAVLLPLLLTGAVRWPRRDEVSRRDRLALVAVSINTALLNLFLFLAFARTAVGIVVICFYIYPGLVALAAVRILGEPLDRRRAGALLLGFGGLALVLIPSLMGAGVRVDPLGVALGLAAAVLQTGSMLFVGRGFGGVPVTVSALAINGASMLAYIALVLIVGSASVFTTVPGVRISTELVIAGVFGAALPSLLSLRGVRTIGAARAAILMMLEAVVSVTLAAIVLSEQLAPIQVLGGAAVLLAGAILQLRDT